MNHWTDNSSNSNSEKWELFDIEYLYICVIELILNSSLIVDLEPEMMCVANNSFVVTEKGKNMEIVLMGLFVNS